VCENKFEQEHFPLMLVQTCHCHAAKLRLRSVALEGPRTNQLGRMLSYWFLRRVALAGMHVSEERITSINWVTRIGELIKIFLRSVRRLLVTANVVPSSPILVTAMMEGLRSSETSVLTRATWRKIPEDGILMYVVCS
jgi:hypothetical protein